MLAYWLIVAHLVGDYLLQSDWMAVMKRPALKPALAHALAYTVPFVLITQSPLALLLIGGSHFAIDHWGLARYLVWAKNFLAPRWIDVGASSPRARNYAWAECEGTGYHKDRPPWLTVWLTIVADNTLHLIANGLAVTYL